MAAQICNLNLHTVRGAVGKLKSGFNECTHSTHEYVVYVRRYYLSIQRISCPRNRPYTGELETQICVRITGSELWLESISKAALPPSTYGIVENT